MSTLNPDILEEILPHLSYDYSKPKSERKKNVEHLKIFMSSGKEPFYAALRYFSHTTDVSVRRSHLSFSVKRFGYNLHKIPYDFEYLDAILNVLPKTFLYIDYPESVEGIRALTILIRFKKFKSLQIQTRNLPPEYIQFFKTECVFDKLTLLDCSGGNPSLLDFFEMDAKHYWMSTNFSVADFIQQCQNLPLFQTFPFVKDLTIEGEDSIVEFVFTMDGLKHLLLIFRDRFPNLLTLNIHFNSHGDCQDAYLEMMKMQPQNFNNWVSPQLKGSISIFVYDYEESFYDLVIEETAYIKENPGFGDFVCEFEIHDGLTFDFNVNVRDY